MTYRSREGARLAEVLFGRAFVEAVALDAQPHEVQVDRRGGDEGRRFKRCVLACADQEARSLLSVAIHDGSEWMVWRLGRTWQADEQHGEDDRRHVGGCDRLLVRRVQVDEVWNVAEERQPPSANDGRRRERHHGNMDSVWLLL